MKNIFTAVFLIALSSLALPSVSFADGMMDTIKRASSTSLQMSMGHTAREEAEGRAVWNKLQSKELTCQVMSNENFGVLGEFFMGQMMGNSHEAMNDMITQRMGTEGEEAMHVTIGKRLSGCDIAAPFPHIAGTPPMMNMMGGEWLTSMNDDRGTYSIMNWRSSHLGFGGLFLMVLWWVLIITGIIVLIRWLFGSTRRPQQMDRDKTPLEILNERYAKGQIDKDDYEARKKDLS